MSSATLSLNDAYQGKLAGQDGQADAVAPSAGFATSYLQGTVARPAGWLRSPGAVGTVLVHGAALLAIWSFSSSVVKPPVAPPVVELIRLTTEPKKELAPPKPEPLKEKPVQLAPPKPVAPAACRFRPCRPRSPPSSVSAKAVPPVWEAPVAPAFPSTARASAAPAPSSAPAADVSVPLPAAPPAA